jgi:hypothetical protein
MLTKASQTLKLLPLLVLAVLLAGCDSQGSPNTDLDTIVVGVVIVVIVLALATVAIVKIWSDR